MHLGPEAMKMIGEGIAQDIAANQGTWFAHETNTTSNDKDTSSPGSPSSEISPDITPSGSLDTTFKLASPTLSSPSAAQTTQ